MSPVFAREWRWLIVCLIVAPILFQAWMVVALLNAGRPWWIFLPADWQGLKILALTSAFGAPLLYLVTGFVRVTVRAFKSN